MTDKKPHLDTQYKKLIEEAAEGVAITSAESILDNCPEIIEVNSALETITGYGRNELIGQNPGILLSEAASPVTMSDIKAHLTSELPYRCRTLIEHKTRRSVWTELSIVPVIKRQSKTDYHALIIKDLSSFVELEELLSEGLVDSQHAATSPQTFSIALHAEWQRAIRHHSTFTVVCCKLVPPASQAEPVSEQITAAGSIYRNQFRKEDTVGRIGKFEFAVLLPETDLSLAANAVIRLQGSVKNSPELNGYNLLTGLAERNLLDTNSDAVLARAQQGVNSNTLNQRLTGCRENL